MNIKNKKGSVSIEYVLLIVLVVLVIIGALVAFGQTGKTTVENATTTIDNASQCALMGGTWDTATNKCTEVSEKGGQIIIDKDDSGYGGKQYTITYNLNGGINAADNPGTYNTAITTILSEPTKDYYDFVGWDDGTGNVQKQVILEKGTTTGNKEYTAVWIPTVYNITYNLDGGTISGQPTTYTIESETLNIPNPIKNKYTFLGWTGSNGDTQQTDINIENGSHGDKVYTANWRANILYGYQTVSVWTTTSSKPTNTSYYTSETQYKIYYYSSCDCDWGRYSWNYDSGVGCWLEGAGWTTYKCDARTVITAPTNSCSGVCSTSSTTVYKIPSSWSSITQVETAAEAFAKKNSTTKPVYSKDGGATWTECPLTGCPTEQ